MSDPQALLPASSATFALTLDQNVSRDVRKRVIALERKTRNAGVASWLLGAAAVVGNAALAAVDPVAVVMGIYCCLAVVPVPPALWWYRKKASSSATLLNQDRDVAFVGPDGLVFFAAEGFFVERSGGFKPYGLREPEPRRFDTVEYFAADQKLMLSSSAGYSIALRVPRGWTDVDTARVREKVEAFTY
jgi:hypothetical protein